MKKRKLGVRLIVSDVVNQRAVLIEVGKSKENGPLKQGM